MKYHVLAIVFCVASSVTGQGQGVPPTPAECQAGVDSLIAGARSAATWQHVSFCGASGAAALVTRLPALSSETDTVYLTGIMGAANVVKDTALLRAAGLLARNAGATSQARIAALGIVLAQYTPSANILGMRGWAGTLGSARGSDCRLGTGGDYDYAYEAPQPPDSLQRIAAELDSVELRTGETALMRDLARCARGMVDEVPAGVPVAALTLTYVCGTTFQVSNSSARPAELTYSVSSEPGETYDVFVRPGASTRFSTMRAGTVDLYQNGVVVRTLKSVGRSCL